MFSGTLTFDVSAISHLRTSMQNRIISPAMTKAIRPIRMAAKANSAKVKRSGALAKSWGVKTRVYRDAVVGVVGPQSKFVMQIGVSRAGKPINARPSFYLHFLEGGGTRITAKPVLAPAYAGLKSSTQSTLVSEIGRNIEKVLSK